MVDRSVSQESPANAAIRRCKGNKLRVAVVGCGWAGDVQLRIFRKIPQVEIVAIVDIDSQRLKARGTEHNVGDLYSDWKQMLRNAKPDAVSVCTPNGLHAQPVIDACNAGCHVMTEKPMAMTPAECEKMIAAAEKNRRLLAVGFQCRFHPNTRFLIRARNEGRFGKIMFVKCQALRRRGIPNWGVFGQKKLQGGGPLIDIGVHVLEMAHYTMGRPKPIAASGNTWTWMGDKPSKVESMWPNWDYKTYTVEDLAIGQIRFETGAFLQIEASFASHIEKDVWNFQLMGEKGGCCWDPPAIFTDQAGTMVNAYPAWLSDKVDYQTLFTHKLQNWVDAIRKGTKLESPGEDGLAVQKMLDGVYRSARAGKEVAIR